MSNHLSTSSVPLLAGLNAPNLLDLLADGVYITDRQRRIVFWSAAAERITGWKAEEVVGWHCRDNILVHVDKDGHALCGEEHCPLHHSVVTGQPSAAPVLVFAQHKRRSRTPVEVMVSPVRNHAGTVIGGIEVFRDLTDYMQDQLRAKRIQAMAVNCPLPADDRVAFETRYQPRDIVGGDFYRMSPLQKPPPSSQARQRGRGSERAHHQALERDLPTTRGRKSAPSTCDAWPTQPLCTGSA